MTTRAKRRIASRKISHPHKTDKSQHRLKVELLPNSAGALATINHSVPKPTIRGTSLVPAPQAERIRSLSRGIASERSREKRAEPRQTILRIVRSEDVQNFVKQMQEELWGLIPAAIGALRHELQTNKNSQLAYQIIRDIGVFLPARIQQPPSPYDSDERVKLIMGEFVKIGLERNRIYGTPMPEIEEAAARAGVKIQLRSAPLDDDDGEINEMYEPEQRS